MTPFEAMLRRCHPLPASPNFAKRLTKAAQPSPIEGRGEGTQLFRLNARIASSSPSSVSGYMRSFISSWITRTEWL